MQQTISEGEEKEKEQVVNQGTGGLGPPAPAWALLLALLEFFALLAQHRLAAQLDLIAFERQHLYQDLVALLQLVPDVFDPVLGNLADVQQAVGAREDLHE